MKRKNEESEEKCRLCLSNKLLLSMFSDRRKDMRLSLLAMINEVINIRIRKEESNSFVCLQCLLDVTHLYIFRLRCMKNEEMFQASCSRENKRKVIKLQPHDLEKNIIPPTLESAEIIMSWLLKKRSSVAANLSPTIKEFGQQVDISELMHSTDVACETVESPKKRFTNMHTQLEADRGEPASKDFELQVNIPQKLDVIDAVVQTVYAFSESLPQENLMPKQESKCTSCQTVGTCILKTENEEYDEDIIVHLPLAVRECGVQVNIINDLNPAEIDKFHIDEKSSSNVCVKRESHPKWSVEHNTQTHNNVWKTGISLSALSHKSRRIQTDKPRVRNRYSQTDVIESEQLKKPLRKSEGTTSKIIKINNSLFNGGNKCRIEESSGKTTQHNNKKKNQLLRTRGLFVSPKCVNGNLLYVESLKLDHDVDTLKLYPDAAEQLQQQL